MILIFWIIPLNNLQSQVLKDFIYNGKKYSVDDVYKSKKPPEGIYSREGLDECRDEVTKLYNIPISVFQLLMTTEGGKNGMIVKSKSKFGRFSYDVGVFQINEINFKSLLKQGINPFMLRFDDCANMIAAAILIEPFYKKAKKETWEMHYKKIDLNKIRKNYLYILAGYNSQTDNIRKKYALRLEEHFSINVLFAYNIY